MEKRYYGILIILLISFGVVIFFYNYIGTEVVNNKNNNEKQYFCDPDQRLVDTCIEIYNPVCGWNDPERIQCIRFPCASTYSNSCFACVNEDVLYWTEGECPSE